MRQCRNLEDIRNLSATTVTVSSKSFLKGPILLGSGQSMCMLPEPTRGPPGAFGQRHPTEHLWQTYDALWQDSTSAGLSECLTSSDPLCGGSAASRELSAIEVGGSIKGDLFYRSHSVPRNRSPSSLHSSAAPEFLGLSIVPLQWMSLKGHKCLLPSHVELQGVFGLEQDPEYANFDQSQRRPFEARSAVVQTSSFNASSIDACKRKGEHNHMCGIVTYEQHPAGGFGCTMSLLPAPSCSLRQGTAQQGVLLYPRDQVTRLTTDAPSTNRKLVFPGKRSGVVLTTGNPTDLWGLPNLINSFEPIPGEEEQTGDIFPHYQRPSVCEGLSTIMPDCTTPSTMDRCIKRYYPQWKGLGSLPIGWQQRNDRTCIKNDERIRVAYQEALANNFSNWMQKQQTPFVGVGFVASGYECRAEYSAFSTVTKVRPDLNTQVFTGSANNDTCSLVRCDTCRLYNQFGKLPPYLDPVDFSPSHPEPESLMNRRITFPDASGTVIASGYIPQANCICTCLYRSLYTCLHTYIEAVVRCTDYLHALNTYDFSAQERG